MPTPIFQLIEYNPDVIQLNDVNYNAQILSALMINSVLSFRDEPTGTEAAGSKYIVQNGTGIFAGHNNKIAVCIVAYDAGDPGANPPIPVTNAEWLFVPMAFIARGKTVYVGNENTYYRWFGNAWLEPDFNTAERFNFYPNNPAFNNYSIGEQYNYVNLYPQQSGLTVDLGQGQSIIQFVAENKGGFNVTVNTKVLAVGQKMFYMGRFITGAWTTYYHANNI